MRIEHTSQIPEHCRRLHVVYTNPFGATEYSVYCYTTLAEAKKHKRPGLGCITHIFTVSTADLGRHGEILSFEKCDLEGFDTNSHCNATLNVHRPEAMFPRLIVRLSQPF